MKKSVTNIARRPGWSKGSIRIGLIYVIVCAFGLCQLGCAYAQLQLATINNQPVRKGESLGIEVTREGEQMTPQLGMELQKGDQVRTPPGVTALIKFGDGSEVTMMPDAKVTIESIFVWFGKVIVRAKGMFKSKTKDVTAGTQSTLYVMSTDETDQSTITMVEGSVLLTSNENSWPSRTLPSGQEASVSGSQPPVIETMSQAKYNEIVRFINQTTESIKGRKAKVFVPKVTRLQEAGARSVLGSAGLKVGKVIKTISDDYLDGDYGIGTVVDQKPAPGKEIKRGGSVTITVRVRDVGVPGVIGRSRGAAMDAIQGAGLTVDGYVPEKITGQYEPGMVINQSPPAGRRVMEGATVKLTVEAVSVEVPNVTGMSAEQAESLIREIGLALRTRPSGLREDVEAPRVVGQDPTGGGRVRPGSSVTINVAKPGVRVPNLVRQNDDAARRLLAGVTLRVGNLSSQWNPQYPAGVVISQSPQAGQLVEPNSRIGLTVSQAGVRVPNLIGRNEKEARNLLERVNLQMGRVSREYHDKYPAGVVMRQSPAAGQLVRPGSSVALTISRGPGRVVPNLINLSQAAAEKSLANSNLRGQVNYDYRERARIGVVIYQSPAAGQVVRPGTTVNFTISVPRPM